MVVAARRSGKTVVSRCLALFTALSRPYALIGYVAPTLNQAKRIFWTPLMRDLRDPAAAAFVEKIDQSAHTVTFKNGSEIRLYSAETRPVERIRGDGFDLIITDESDDLNFTPYVYNEIIWPALGDRQGILLEVGTPKGRGRLYKEFRKGQVGSPEYDPTYWSAQVSAIEAGLLLPSEIERARRTLPTRSFKQEYMASFEAPLGIVYDEYVDSMLSKGGHVVRDDDLPAQFDEIIVGVDWGTAHFGVMMVLGLDKVWIPPTRTSDGWTAGRAWVLEEHVHAGKGYDDGGWWAVARDIQSRWQPTAWYGDPAGGLEGYIRQLANALDGSAAEVYPAKNQVRPGIATVRQFMHHDAALGEPPRLLVHERCGRLRGELQSYRFRPHPTVEDAFTDQVVKEGDDCCDGLRYGLASHFDEALH